MRREDKFGYGFLLASIGVPVLIVVIWGEKFAAAVVGSIFVVAGFTFLIAGHRHKEAPGRRGRMATVVIFILAGAAMGASVGLLSGLSYVVLKRKQPEVAERKPEIGHPEVAQQPQPAPRDEGRGEQPARPKGEPRQHPKREPQPLPTERQLTTAKFLTATKILQEFNFRNGSPGTIDLGSLIADDEAEAFRLQLGELFQRNNWNVAQVGSYSARWWETVSTTPPYDIVILSRNHDYQTTLLRDLFEAIGMKVHLDYRPKNFNELPRTIVFVGANR